MVTYGVEFRINGRYTNANATPFTTIEDDILNISPHPNPHPKVRDEHTISMQGGSLDLRLLGLSVSASDFCEYWEEISSPDAQHPFPLERIVRELLRAQGARVATGVFSMYPEWVELAELVGLMRYFEESHDDAVIHWGTEKGEICNSIRGVLDSRFFDGILTAQRRGIPQLDEKIKSYVAELRFAREVSKAGFEFRFLDEKGDVRIETDPVLRIDATRHFPGYSVEYNHENPSVPPQFMGLPRAVTVAGTLRGLRQVAQKPALNKFTDHGREIDGIAVDSTLSLAGVQAMGVSQFGNSPEVGPQINRMAELRDRGQQPVLVFQRILGPHASTVTTLSTREAVTEAYRRRVNTFRAQLQALTTRM